MMGRTGQDSALPEILLIAVIQSTRLNLETSRSLISVPLTASAWLLPNCHASVQGKESCLGPGPADVAPSSLRPSSLQPLASLSALEVPRGSAPSAVPRLLAPLQSPRGAIPGMAPLMET